MHGQERHADVDRLDTEPRGRQRPNGATAGHSVIRHKFLGGLARLEAGLEPQRLALRAGSVPLVSVDLQHRASAHDGMLIRIVELSVIRIDGMPGVRTDAAGSGHHLEELVLRSAQRERGAAQHRFQNRAAGTGGRGRSHFFVVKGGEHRNLCGFRLQ